KRFWPGGGVVAAVGIVKQSKHPLGHVGLAGRVAEERPSANSGVLVGSGCKKGPGPRGGIEITRGVAFKRNPTNTCVKCSGRQTKEGILSLCRIASGIASVGCRTDRLRRRRNSNRHQGKSDGN